MTPSVPVFDVADHRQPPRAQASGVHIVLTPYTEIHTPAGPSRWTVDGGARVYLLDGGEAVAVAEVIDSRDAQPQRQAAAVAEITPWARTLAHLARTWRLDDRQKALRELLEDRGYVQVYRDASEELQTVHDKGAWARKIRDTFASNDDPAELEGAGLGAAILARLSRERAAVAEAALATLPPVDQTLPPLSALWELPWGPRLPGAVRPWNERIFPLLAQRWKQDLDTSQRDTLIHWALQCGISKADIHRATGIARTTIDRTLESTPPTRSPR
ncbi:hypothetical protein [Streptomyces aureocirculatus]|uniref:hypothetical protein n=2 Tax=Streptomyces aureocirculatus TaxID=67275 RepID=UPI0004CBBAE0|nr:hypothetical protein [Streptomyces aureocirculatus]